VRLVDDPVLRTRCEPVTAFDENLGALVDDMMATMAGAGGVGLAANQVGVLWRVFVYSCPDGSGTRRSGHVINPVLTVDDPHRTVDDVPEGCLSLPEVHGRLARPAHAVVTGRDRHGAPVTVDGTGLLARCLVHEVDHLDGVLYFDHLSRLARARLLRSYASTGRS
jgi:peptide deformylase